MKNKNEKDGVKLIEKSGGSYMNSVFGDFNPNIKSCENGDVESNSFILEEFFKKALPFHFDVLFLFLTEVYKREKLKETGYKMNMTIDTVICGSVGQNTPSKTYRDVLDFSKIILQKNDKKISISSYLRDKIWVIREILCSREVGRGIKNKYTDENISPLGSRNISKVLSSDFSLEDLKINKNNNNYSFEIKKGNENIFESDELLDQLIVSFLIKIARHGHRHFSLVTIEILQALLFDQLFNDFKSYCFKNKINDNYFDNKIRELVLFVYRVIKNDEGLPDRFKFKLNNKQSLRHWLFGDRNWKGLDEKRDNIWFPKIFEYLQDEKKGDYFLSKGKKFKKEEISLEKKLPNRGDDEGRLTVGDIIEDEDSFSAIQNKALVRQIFDYIEKEESNRDVNIFKDFVDGYKFEEIADKYNIKKARVSQIVTKTKNNILNKFGDNKD